MLVFEVPLNPFIEIGSFYLKYFFYGTAFLVLGLAITITSMKGSNLRIGDSLWLLGWFGYLQSLREWMRVYPLHEGGNLTPDSLWTVTSVSILLLIVSFLFLLKFGISLISGGSPWKSLLLMGIPIFLFIASVLVILHDDSTITKMQFLRAVRHAARNSLGLAGGLMAAWGLISYARETRELNKPISRHFFYAGLAFASYSIVVTGIFSDVTRSLPPYSKEIIRGIDAVLITYCIMKALNIFNIDMRKRVEKQSRYLVQAEKLASLGKLAAGIAHEINNPLTNATLGLYRLKGTLQNNGEDEEAIARVHAVDKNIKRASVIAQELLLFSRQQESDFVPLSLNQVITSSLMLMKHKMNSVDVQQNLSQVPDIVGDRGKLEQVFINVFSNALEAMPGGGVLSITTLATENSVEALISDTGTGIAEENQSRVFEPFFTTKEIGEGTGLGLSISYGIIRQHHGVMELSGSVGKGTTMKIAIPVGVKQERTVK